MEKQLSADETNDTTSLLEVDLRSKDLSPLHRKHHFTFTCSTRRLVLLCCTGVLFTASILRILVYAASSITCPKQKVHRLTCGRSVDEAKALGCVYDTLAHEWTPEPCFDESTMLEYQARVDWHGYRTIESMESTSLEQMASTSPPNTFFAGESDHIIHCALIWQRQPRSYIAGAVNMDWLSASLSHTVHCSKMIMSLSEAMYGVPGVVHMTESTTGFGRRDLLVYREKAWAEIQPEIRILG